MTDDTKPRTYPDDQLTSHLRAVGNDIRLAIDMACETMHDNPGLVAQAIDGDQHSLRQLEDQIRIDHSLCIPVNGDVMQEIIQIAIKRATNE